MNGQPLADIMRPTTLEDVVGQEHMLGEGKVLTNIIRSGNIGNMIFYGPSGTGKTTLSHIIARQTDKRYYKLNATTCSISDIKDITNEVDTLLAPNGILLYLDEIQYFNKKQQQTLLEFIETGKITMIASTTENPYFYVYNAILSRCNVFQFKPVSPNEIEKALKRAIQKVETAQNIHLLPEEGVLPAISQSCGGDVRKALNMLEALILAAKKEGEHHVLTMEGVSQLCSGSAMRYDRDGDSHYDILSAFQKSIRGSDPNAALHYAARLIEAGDLISLCRRLLVCASEDIGLAYPMGLVLTKSCIDSAMQLGLPEARIPLAQAIITLCNAPKSNSGMMAMDAALADVRKGGCGDIPAHLKDAHYEGAKHLGHGLTYQYPHDFPGHYVEQQYLPDPIKDRVYYQYGPNKTEQASKAYWDKIKHPAPQED
jgi:putative ATPase